jgi:hypothetical protein
MVIETKIANNPLAAQTHDLPLLPACCLAYPKIFVKFSAEGQAFDRNDAAALLKFFLTPPGKFTNVNKTSESIKDKENREMKRVLTSFLTGFVLLVAIFSCATVPKGPLGPGEMRLLSLDVPDNGNLKTGIAYQLTIRFEADGRPETRRICFTWDGEGLRCIPIKAAKYGSDASFDVPHYSAPGHHLLECYVEYVRDGKVRKTNVVGSYVNGM